MKSVSRVLAALASTAALATGLTAASPIAAVTSPRQAQRPGRTSGTASAVTLLNGDQLPISSRQAGASRQAGQDVVLTPASRASALISLAVGTRSYEIPAYALPYLGRGLDPRLFSLQALRRHETGGRIPVDIGYSGRPPQLPGITITRAAGGHAAGYLTRSSARLFGRALARQFAADRGRGRYGTDGLFGAMVSISLAGDPAGSSRRAQPAGQVPLAPATQATTPGTAALHTLTFHADDALGQPDNGGGVFLVSLDNSNQLEAFATFVGGTARFTAPAGHYFAAASFVDEVASSQLEVGERLVVVPQIDVHADMTLRTDERTARSRVDLITPRPAFPTFSTFEVRRTPAAGPPIIASASTFETPIRVNTTRRPPTGRLSTFVEELATSPPMANSPYRYMLAYQDLSGAVRSQRRLIRPAGLATVHASFADATAGSGTVAWTGFYPPEVNDGGVTSTLLANSADVPIPSRLTEYFTAAPSLEWTVFAEGPHLFLLQFDSRSYQPGTVATEFWNAVPLHPGPDVRVPGATIPGPLVASATRSGNVFTMHMTPFTDNIPGHLGSGLAFEPLTGGRFTVDDNGKLVASGDATSSPTWQATLSRKPSVIRFVLDTTRGASLYRLSTRSHTVWTWRSAPRSDATLPAGWTCPSIFVTNLVDRQCAAQPLLTLEYHVARLSQRETVPAGRQSVTIVVAHIQPSDGAASITSVRARVSFDSGETWHDATIKRTGPGRFAAMYSAPRSARFAALDVSAADAAGSTIDETLIRAYQISR